MAVLTFAAIVIGSSDVTLEIFEISRKQGVKSLDLMEHSMELGKEAYAQKRISSRQVEEICKVLKDFQRVMKSYQTVDYRICATSAFREAGNVQIVLDKIYQATGMQVTVLSNSEQRFLDYKSIACMEADFPQIIAKGTAVLDIGGGSLQISLFDKENLITTQNIRLGSLRIRELLQDLNGETADYETLVKELIHGELSGFRKVHLKERKVSNMILIGDDIFDVIVKYLGEQRVIPKEQFLEMYQNVMGRSAFELAMFLQIPLDQAARLIPTVILYRCFMEQLGAEMIWAPGTRLHDGIAYDFAEQRKMIRPSHSFDNDIVMAAKNIGKRYGTSKVHVQLTEKAALSVYDAMKKIHGLGARERLLLQCAVYVHDCGRYVSLSNAAQCGYQIVMATEIIGLSHKEREMIAEIVRFHTVPLISYEEMSRQTDLGLQEYLTVTKLTAILRLADAMDRSHLQKVTEMQASVREGELRIRLTVQQDFTLELGLLEEHLDFFEEVCGIRPLLKVKRDYQ